MYIYLVLYKSMGLNGEPQLAIANEVYRSACITLLHTEINFLPLPLLVAGLCSMVLHCKLN